MKIDKIHAELAKSGYRSEKAADEDGWRHVRVVLEPNNPEFRPIELKTEDEGSVAVVAELVDVIGAEPPF